MHGTKGEPGRVPDSKLRLGCTPRYVDGRVFVTKVLPESQAEVDEVVLAGDILDEINGCSLRYACPGQVGGDRGLGCAPLFCPPAPLCSPLPPGWGHAAEAEGTAALLPLAPVALARRGRL